MLDLLKEVRVFEGCTVEELREISAISHVMALQNGERVFETQTPAEYLYIVAKGTVELKFAVTHYRVSKEITIDRIQENDVFGWSALGRHRAYTLSASAVGDSELVRISAKDIEKLSAENNHLGYVLMKNIADTIGERFDLVQRMLIDLIQQNLAEKEV